jgi:hypothetical protein
MRKIVSYGGGVNGVAMLISMVRSGNKPDAILFADTGGEVDETYAYNNYFSEWLVSKGFPPITVVEYRTKKHRRVTLEQEILKAKTLPSVAFGFKTCSQKHKIFPQQKWVDYNFGKESCEWYIGFDSNESRRMGDNNVQNYINKYPLIELGWDRERCKEEILSEGLELPVKSACYFCPNRKKHEIVSLPDKFKKRAISIEKNAILTSMKGLGRWFSWTDLLNGQTQDADAQEKRENDFKNITGEELEPPFCECI